MLIGFLKNDSRFVFKKTVMRSLIIIFFSFIYCIKAQQLPQEIQLKKGEVFDLLLILAKPNSSEKFKHYRETIIPIGQEMSYKPLGFTTIKKTILGNLQPTSLILAKWDNIRLREQFIQNITAKVADFHEQRKEIWDIFLPTYYEIDESKIIRFKKEKTYTLTAYWKKDDKDLTNFMHDWQSLIALNQGKNILILKDGRSPVGYYYNPDILIFTEWDKEDDFISFKKANSTLNFEAVENYTQFLF